MTIVIGSPFRAGGAGRAVLVFGVGVATVVCGGWASNAPSNHLPRSNDFRLGLSSEIKPLHQTLVPQSSPGEHTAARRPNRMVVKLEGR
jgi:hypothetical protein